MGKRLSSSRPRRGKVAPMPRGKREKGYTSVRARLFRLEVAVDKDERLEPEDKGKVKALIQGLVTFLLDIDRKYPIEVEKAVAKRGKGKAASSAAA
jgi:hypothetical protein